MADLDGWTDGWDPGVKEPTLTRAEEGLTHGGIEQKGSWW